MINPENITKGAKNILENCADLSKNQTLLIISEDPVLGWYKKDITDALAAEAKGMSIKTTILEVGGPQNDSKSKLTKVIDDFEPDFIFYLVGVDVLENDKLGRLGLTIKGCKKRDKFVLELCRKNNVPIQISMGGGYSVNIKDILEAHSNLSLIHI